MKKKEIIPILLIILSLNFFIINLTIISSEEQLNLPPVIVNYNSFYDETIIQGYNLTFYVNAADNEDNINDTLTYKWYVNNVLKENKTVFELKEINSGFQEIKVEVSDGNLTAHHIWQITVATKQQTEIKKVEPFFLIAPWIAIILIIIILLGLITYYIIKELKAQ